LKHQLQKCIKFSQVAENDTMNPKNLQLFTKNVITFFSLLTDAGPFNVKDFQRTCTFEKQNY